MLTALQMILAENEAYQAIIKALAVWIVVDIDNYIARYLVEAFEIQASWVHVDRGRPEREMKETFLFFLLPGVLYWTLLAVCMYGRILPLSYAYYGVVSNRDPPRMLGSDLALPEGCCPPLTEHTRTYLFF